MNVHRWKMKKKYFLHDVLLNIAFEQCCNELEISWNTNTIYKNGMTLPSPVGKYEKVKISINSKPVYHNVLDDYFIYSQKLNYGVEEKNVWMVRSFINLFN